MDKFRGALNKGPRDYVCDVKEDPEAGVSWVNDRRGVGTLLQADPASVQHVQE